MRIKLIPSHWLLLHPVGMGGMMTAVMYSAQCLTNTYEYLDKLDTYEI